MADVYRITTIWNGFTGAPGYTRMSWSGLNTPALLNQAGAATHDFFLALAAYLKVGWSLQVQSTVQVYEASTGTLLREDAMTTVPAAVAGTALSGTAFSGGVGARVQWHTGVIWFGHRVTGRTYLVPLAGVNEADGSLSSAAITSIQNASNALISSVGSGLSVWTKRYNTQPPGNQLDGITWPVTTATVPDKTGILKSRRD